MKYVLALAVIIGLGLTCSAQLTQVTAQVKDANNSLYVNCQWSVIFVNQNTTPGAGPSQPANLLNGYQGNCDSFGNLTVALADNINTITPTPSQWSFSICSAQGYVAGPYCRTNMLVTITGTSQNLTSFFQPLMPLLPPSGGSGGTLPTATVGKYLVSTGVNVNPVFQTKALYDVRDWAICNTPVGTGGGSNVTAALKLMLATIGTSQTTVQVIGTTNPTNSCLVDAINWPANVTLDFSGGGSLTLTTTLTPTGGGAVDGTAVGNFNSSATSSCSLTLSVPTTGDTIFLFTTYQFAVGTGFGPPTDTASNLYRLISSDSSNIDQFQTNTFGWMANNVSSGSVTITIPYLAATKNTCGAFAISGLGPSVAADGLGSSCDSGGCTTGSPMTVAFAATFTAGSFLVSFGGQLTQTQTCTAGAGFTQVLNVGTGVSLCAQVQNSAAGGSITPTQSINNTPTTDYWMYNVAGMLPVRTVQSILGGINNPNRNQIFYQAYGSGDSQGSIDFTGNIQLESVYPEWWGATVPGSATTNTLALQAAEHGAFGTGRTNSSGLAIYNKTLVLRQNYSINGELKFYHVIGSLGARATIQCDGGGITQTASNARIIDGQSVAYFQTRGCSWAGTASSTKPLIDYDFDGTQGVDLRPQFIDHYGDTFGGAGLVDTGVLIAKTGGGAQGSNIYCHNCESSSFTGAAWQIGGNNTGRNVGRFYAQNALAINYDGDIQGCPLYGIAVYGGGYVGFGSNARISTMENGYFTQTGVDMYCEATQGPCVMEHVRSESLALADGNWLQIKDSRTIDQATRWGPLGSSGSGLFYAGYAQTWDGAFYKVTTPGTFGPGINFSTPNIASSGTATSITDTNQTIAGSVTQGTFTVAAVGETMTQAVSGSTGNRVNAPSSVGTITGSVTSGTIVVGDTVTQAVSGASCKVQTPAPTGSGNLLVAACSGTADNSHLWTDGGSGGTYTPTSTPSFAATTLLVTATTGSPDSTHDWVGGTTAAHFTPTASPVNQAAYTVNAFVGELVGISAGTGVNCYALITSNTAQTITFTGGFLTKYDHTVCPSTDTTTNFYTDLNWNRGTITSGTATLQFFEFDVIGTCTGCAGAVGRLEDMNVSGGRINFWSSPQTKSTISDVIVSRTDWLNQGSNTPFQDQMTHDWDVRVINGQFGGPVIQWAYPASGGTNFNGALHRDLGGIGLCWNTGTIGQNSPSPANSSANEVCLGGRSYPGLSTDTFVQRVELNGGVIPGIGPATPTGTNQNGNDFNLLGGDSTGTGTPGKINFRIATTGSSGIIPNGGVTKAGVDSSGLLSSYDGSFGSQYGQAASACETSFGITTLNTGGTTTDTGLSCLPAGAVIDAVLYRITTTITTAANFTIGDASTAARFCTTQSTLTAGTTGTCFAQSGTSAQQQATAAKVRVTTNANPGAGAIRLIVYYHTWVAPTS